VKLYLDENLSPRIAELLRARGLDAVGALQAGNAQLTDFAQLRYATSQGRALVTADVADFVALAAELIASNTDHAGIVLVSAAFRTNNFAGIADALARVAGHYPDGIPGTVLHLSRYG
jgi:Domain of unknown function (DUF5615)